MQDYTLRPLPMSLLHQAERRQTAKLRSFIDAALQAFAADEANASGL
ncbi:hypothetical protein LGH83_16245 [Lichenihabitans sp. PAMC28606]|nr:hypothetical protein [Lichenihabitans sp. PAMC28606]UDL96809.1 hypothetical protein LGH83_16245 [Lichenihabitans sp. PAMC28606]